MGQGVQVFIPLCQQQRRALVSKRLDHVLADERDAATARKTVEGYLEIFQDTLLATLLPAFEPRLRVRERRHPKLYWVDPGLV